MAAAPHRATWAKAFGGGADFVMLGGMLAGHDECGGEIVERGGEKLQRFYGMSSRTAMDLYSGGVAEYRAAEGKEVLVPIAARFARTVQTSWVACARPALMSVPAG